jgi:hypothetical protein
MEISVWPIVLLIGLGTLATVAGRASVRGRGIAFAAAATGVGLAVAQQLALRPAPLVSMLYSTALLLPVSLTALIARAEVRRGRTLWRAGGVAFILGGTVGALMPLLVAYLVVVGCAVTGDCP